MMNHNQSLLQKQLQKRHIPIHQSATKELIQQELYHRTAPVRDAIRGGNIYQLQSCFHASQKELFPELDLCPLAEDFFDDMVKGRNNYYPDDMSKHLHDESIDLSLPVIAISLGGTNIKRAGATLDPNNEATLDRAEHSSAKKYYPNAKAFFLHLLGQRSLEYIQKMQGSCTISLCMPIRMLPTEQADRVCAHLSSKYRIPDLAPFDTNEEKSFKAKRLPIIKSLKTLIANKTGYTPKHIIIVPNDTIAGAWGYKQTNQIQQGLLVCGTGGNISLKKINTECGWSMRASFSILDLLVLDELEIPHITEVLFSGKIMDKLFESYTKIYCGPKNGVVDMLAELSSTEKTKLMFSYAYLDYHHDKLSLSENVLLKLISQKLTQRAAQYTAALLTSVAMFGEKNIPNLPHQLEFFAEGSLVTKNPLHRDEINKRCARNAQKRSQSAKLVQGSYNISSQTEIDESLLDASLVGTCCAPRYYKAT